MAKSVYYSLAVLSIALLQLVNTNAIYSRRCHSRDEYYNPAKRSCQKLCTPCEPGFVEVFRCVAPLRMPTICRQFDEILNRIPKTYTSDYLKISHNLRQRTIRQDTSYWYIYTIIPISIGMLCLMLIVLVIVFFRSRCQPFYDQSGKKVGYVYWLIAQKNPVKLAALEMELHRQEESGYARNEYVRLPYLNPTENIYETLPLPVANV